MPHVKVSRTAGLVKGNFITCKAVWRVEEKKRKMSHVTVLEFVALPAIPLHKILKRAIARTIAERPGLNSAVWFARIQEAFQKIEDNPSIFLEKTFMMSIYKPL